MIVRHPPKINSPKGLARYVQVDLFTWLKNFAVGMNGNVDFDSNFNSFLAKDIVIAAGATALVTNELSVIPTERYIVRQTGDGVITDGAWTANTLELVNQGSGSVTISVRFFAVFSPLER